MVGGEEQKGEAPANDGDFGLCLGQCEKGFLFSVFELAEREANQSDAVSV